MEASSRYRPTGFIIYGIYQVNKLKIKNNSHQVFTKLLDVDLNN
jgi:hypothetical protein